MEFARMVGRLRLDLELLRGSAKLYYADKPRINEFFDNATDDLGEIRKEINMMLNKMKGGDEE